MAPAASESVVQLSEAARVKARSWARESRDQLSSPVTAEPWDAFLGAHARRVLVRQIDH